MLGNIKEGIIRLASPSVFSKIWFGASKIEYEHNNFQGFARLLTRDGVHEQGQALVNVLVQSC